jgi:hypothetical protein
VKVVRLRIVDAAVTDDGLAALAPMRGLEEVHVEGTPVTDAGARELARLKRLKRVVFARTKVTPAGAKALRDALPGVPVDLE